MDSNRLDQLVRSIGDNSTRRGIIRLLAGMVLGSVARPLASTAKKRRNHKKSRHHKKSRKHKNLGARGNDGTAPANVAKPPNSHLPKKSYLALGDSLAFGYQSHIFDQHFPDVPPTLFERGYVDELSDKLRLIQPSIETTNYGCPGETTDSFIRGGCPFTMQGFALHDSYSGSQFDAALVFLHLHHGQVSPITLNLGTNELNALQLLCRDDVACYEREGPIVLDQIARNLDVILGALRWVAPNSEILTFTHYSVGFLIDPRFLQLTGAFNDVVRTTAEAHRVRVADVFAAFNDQPQPATICNLTLVCTPASDSHPSDAGYQVIADQLWQVSGYE